MSWCSGDTTRTTAAEADLTAAVAECTKDTGTDDDDDDEEEEDVKDEPDRGVMGAATVDTMRGLAAFLAAANGGGASSGTSKSKSSLGACASATGAAARVERRPRVLVADEDDDDDEENAVDASAVRAADVAVGELSTSTGTSSPVSW